MTSTFDIAALDEEAPAPAAVPVPAPQLPVPEARQQLAGWWPVALSGAVADKPVAAQVLDQCVALYRDGTGTVRAVEDMCPHRRLPLSLGRVTEGNIQCGYHGWMFNGANGACTKIPNLSAKERPSPRIKVPVFATAERDGFVLVALTGEQDLPLAAAGTADASYSFVLRSPHAEVVRAIVWNPGRVLGLGLVLGEGEQDTDPLISTRDGRLVVERARQTLPLRRIGTYGHVVDHRTTTRVEVPTSGGLVEVLSDHALLGGSARVLVGVQPLSAYTSRIHVAARISGPPAATAGLRTALRLAAVAARRGHRAAARAEQVADETAGRRDPDLVAVDTHRSTPTSLDEGAAL